MHNLLFSSWIGIAPNSMQSTINSLMCSANGYKMNHCYCVWLKKIPFLLSSVGENVLIACSITIALQTFTHLYLKEKEKTKSEEKYFSIIHWRLILKLLSADSINVCHQIATYEKSKEVILLIVWAFLLLFLFPASFSSLLFSSMNIVSNELLEAFMIRYYLKPHYIVNCDRLTSARNS